MGRIAALTICLFLCMSALVICSQALSISYGHFNSPEEYEAFLKNTHMPSDYIHASRFSIFGSLDYGLMQSADRRSYYYLFSNGFSLSIRHGLTIPIIADNYLETIPDNLTSMLTMPPQPDGKSFSYYRNGLYYNYYGNSGNLSCLEWFADGIYFRLNIDDYPKGGINPLIDRLLSADENTATAAFQELCNSADLSPGLSPIGPKNEFITRILEFVLITGLILTGILTYLSKK